MHITSRLVVLIAILVLTFGFSVSTDVSDLAPRQDQTKVRCAWPAGATRGCRQKSLLQTITARSWQMAKYDAVLLA